MSASIKEALWLISPGIILGASFIGSFVYYAVKWLDEKPSERRREGSILVPSLFIDFFYWFVDPFVEGLGKLGVRPNHVTCFSLIAATASGIAFASGYFMTGFWMLFAMTSGDVLDGLLARRQQSGTSKGAFFDSFVDRLAEGCVYAGLAYYGDGGLMTWLSIWAMIASFAVSYARARGEALGVDCAVGLMQRAERMLVLILGTFFSPIVSVFVEPDTVMQTHHLVLISLAIIGPLSSITAFNRMQWIMKKLERDGEQSSEFS